MVVLYRLRDTYTCWQCLSSDSLYGRPWNTQPPTERHHSPRSNIYSLS